MKNNNIEEKLKQTLIENFQNQYDLFNNRPQMTSAIKECIVNLGYEYDFGVCCSEFADEPEWLFDIVWYETSDVDYLNSGFRIIKKLQLIVESELDARLDAIRIDFEKLLISNSKYKLMVCMLGINDINQLKQYFIDSIKFYENSSIGDRYLIAIFDENEGEFEFVSFEKDSN